MKKTYLWKSLKAGLKSGHDNSKWKIGVWRKATGKASACSNGFHGSKNVIHAMGFVNAEVLAKVEVRGKSDIRDDKQAWTEMMIVEAYQWKKEDSVRLAIYAAELVIDIYEKEYPNDNRPRKAIEAAKAWLKNPNHETAASASYAATSAFASYAAAASYAATSATAATAASYAATSAAASYAATAASYAAASASYAATSAFASYAAATSTAATEKEIREKCAKFVLSILKKKTLLK